MKFGDIYRGRAESPWRDVVLMVIAERHHRAPRVMVLSDQMSIEDVGYIFASSLGSDWERVDPHEIMDPRT